MSKTYPDGPITRYGSKILTERTHPVITYKSHDEQCEWFLYGGLAPYPGVQRGAYLVDGLKGMHPPFSFVDLKGARQDGTTVQHTVYDPAEMDLQVEFTVPPNNANPGAASDDIRRVIRDWYESWDPKNPGTLSVITPEMGRWWCQPRLFKSPPDRQFKAQSRRLRQRYTWSIRNDNAFWRGVDSVSVFDQTGTVSSEVQVEFPVDTTPDLGPQWSQTVNGVGSYQVQDGQAVWVPSGNAEADAVNVLAGLNDIQTVSFQGAATGGTFKLVYNPGSHQTANIAYNATPAAVQAALEAVPQIGAGNVRVTGKVANYSIEFINALGLQDIPLLGTISNLIGSNPPVVVGQNGASGSAGAGGAGATQITINTGPPIDAVAGQSGAPGTPGWPAPNPPPPPLPTNGMNGAPGSPGAPPPDTASLNIFGWFDGAQLNGVQGNISNGMGILYSIINGVTTVIGAAFNIIGTIAEAAITLVAEIVEVAVGIFQTVVSLIVAGIAIVVGIIAGIIGTVFQVLGFGAHAGANANGQTRPPGVTGVGAGPRLLTAAGHLTLTNFGDQDGYPRYLVYGPGIFRIANGPNSNEMVEFGPLLNGQIALLTTLPRLRGVVDLTPGTASLAVTPEFDDFFNSLKSLAVNSNLGPLLQWFQSLFGIRPPQGYMYALLKGRFSRPIPPKPAGAPPVPAQINCEILNGTASSKIVAALTPLRRWPE